MRRRRLASIVLVAVAMLTACGPAPEPPPPPVPAACHEARAIVDWYLLDLEDLYAVTPNPGADSLVGAYAIERLAAFRRAFTAAAADCPALSP